MVSTDVEVKRWGNSFGVIIPKEAAKKLKLEAGKELSLEITLKEKISGFGLAKGAKSFKRELEEREF